jgi:hypothetical protein
MQFTEKERNKKVGKMGKRILVKEKLKFFFHSEIYKDFDD